MWSHCYWEGWPIMMIGPRALRSVVAHRFAIPVLVLWAGLRKSPKLNLDGETNSSSHLQSSAGDARMQTQVETSVGWFSLFQWEPSKVFIPILRARIGGFPTHRWPARRFSPIGNWLFENLWRYQLNIFPRGIKTCGHQFSGFFVVFSVNSRKHSTSIVEFGQKSGEIKDKPPKNYIGLQLGVKL
jgi:hypothetical protein